MKFVSSDSFPRERMGVTLGMWLPACCLQAYSIMKISC